MKIRVLVLISLLGIAYAAPDEKYTTKYDNVDVDSILKSDRLVENYISCALDKGKCTPEGAELKRVLPDALKTECSKCSDRQRNSTGKVLKFLAEKKRDKFDLLLTKYDPEGIYRNKYRDEYAKQGIIL